MPQGRTGTIVAWLLIAASVVYLAAVRHVGSAGRPRDAGIPFKLRLSARYAVGVHALFAGIKTGPTTGPIAGPSAGLLPELDAEAAKSSPDGRLIVAVVAGGASGPAGARERLSRAGTPGAPAAHTAG